MTNREEFTAWYLEATIDLLGKGIESQARLNLEWLRDNGSFADPSLRLALMAWEASRETLQIDFSPCNVQHSSYNNIDCYAISDVAVILKRAGLEMKP